MLWFAVPCGGRKRPRYWRAVRRLFRASNRGVLSRVGVVLALGMFAAVAASCDRVEAPTEPRTAPVADDADLTASKPVRAKVVTGQPMKRIVAWPDPTTRDVASRDALPEAARIAIDDAPVPMLAPSEPDLLGTAVVTTGAHWAALSTNYDGLNVSLHVSGQAKVYEHIPRVDGTHTVRGKEGFVTQNEGVWSAAWIEHGVAYSLELECASPEAPACTGPETITELVESLTYVGGRGEAHP